MTELSPYDQYATEYDAWFEKHKTEYELELQAIKALLPKRRKIVEIGAGTGKFTQPLGIDLGVEPSESMRAIATNRGVKIIAGKAEALPLPDHSFSCALMVTTDCFLDSLETAFNEAARILKDNGNILIGMIDRDSALGKKYEARKTTSKFYKDASFHTVTEIRDALTNTGFGNFEYSQAVLPEEATEQEPVGVKPGFGQGSFVVIRATRGAD